MKIAFKSIFICLLIALAGVAFSQDKGKLEKDKKQLLKDIEFTKELLKKASSDKKSSLDQLETLKKQIELREKMVSNISKEISVLNSEIEETNDIVEAMEKDLDELKKSYARMLYNAYKNRSSINQLIFIFSARSFNDAFQRMKYIQQFSAFRKRQAEMIDETKKTLMGKNSEKEKQKSEKEDLLKEEQHQQKQLSEEKNEKDDIIASLQQQERKLKKEIKKKEDAAQKLNQKIEEIIQREIEAARKKAEEEKKKGNLLTLTPETVKLSAEFAQNQGKLPWPVERGIISSTFGEHQHPVLTKVKTFNNGVDIKTYEDAKVRAVFDGTVISVVYNPGFQKAIIVRHGEYFTVYSNLKEVYVKSGENVVVKQNIGAVYTDEKDAKSDVHLEVWKGTQKLNPALWIYAQNP